MTSPPTTELAWVSSVVGRSLFSFIGGKGGNGPSRGGEISFVPMPIILESSPGSLTISVFQFSPARTMSLYGT